MRVWSPSSKPAWSQPSTVNYPKNNLTIPRSDTKYPNPWKHAQSSNLRQELSLRQPPLSSTINPLLKPQILLRNQNLKRSLLRDLLVVAWAVEEVATLLEMLKRDRGVSAVVSQEVNPDTSTKAARITKQTKDLPEVLAAEVASVELREHVVAEALEVEEGKDQLQPGDTPILTSTLHPGDVAPDQRENLLIDLSEEVTEVLRNVLLLRAVLPMPEEVVALIRKAVEPTREAGALLNPEAAADSCPVVEATFNRLLAEQTDPVTKAVAAAVLSLEVGVATKAAAEGMRW